MFIEFVGAKKGGTICRFSIRWRCGSTVWNIMEESR